MKSVAFIGLILSYPIMAIEIQGHRGVCGDLVPENTIAAFKQAILEGAHSIELDVQVSADNVVFVCHDSVLKSIYRSVRLIPVSCYSYDEIKELSGVNPARGEYAALPTLEAVFSYFKDVNVVFDIEIKSRFALTHKARRLAEQVCRVVYRNGMQKKIRIRSFDAMVLVHAQKLYSALETVLNTSAHHWVLEARRLNVSIVAPAFKRVTKKLIKEAHLAGIKVIPWTVNKVEDFQTLVSWHVDGITTDQPRQLHHFLSQHNHQELIHNAKL